MQNTNLVSIPVAAKMLGIKPQTARDWLWKNKFPVRTIKINGKRLVSADLLNEYIQNLIYSSSSVNQSNVTINTSEVTLTKPS